MTLSFEPIAVVGRACVLPGALSPAALWRLVLESRDVITAAPAGSWGLDHDRVLARGPRRPDQAVSDRGGYVTGFGDVFDPARYGVAPAAVADLDPLFHWLLHVVHGALTEARVAAAARQRTSLVVGNLCYSTRLGNDYAERVWGFSSAAASPRNRFASGLPAHLTAQWLGLGGPCFALDAACASSLYAISNACDQLHDRRVDVAVAAGVNHADDLFLHVGFSELHALSPSGRSRPFHRDADGLLPAQGAAAVALKRLDDARRDGDRIFGVIRGVGLSNDGRRGGVLAPDAGQQAAAMRAAYEMAGMDPRDVGLVECHATGTQVGDQTEIESMAAVFAATADLPVGSLKSNLGHLITAAGLGGLIKLLGALADGVKPPTLHVDAPMKRFSGTPLRPLRTAEPWNGRRIAGLNAFGFGGSNAHLIVEQWTERWANTRSSEPARRFARLPRVAVCGIGVHAGSGRGVDAFERHLFTGSGPATTVDKIDLPLGGLRAPPADLRASLPQQTLMLEVALDAAAMARVEEGPRTGVLVGINCDLEIARCGLRWRGTARGFPEAEGAVSPLTTAAVIGGLPNIPANRLNAQFGATAFGYSVASEELSGCAALHIAARALATGAADAVIVGAIETLGDRVHEAAAAAVMPAEMRTAGEGAVALVLRRLDDPVVLAEGCLATLATDPSGAAGEIPALPGDDVVRARFGHVHAAHGLLEVVAAICAQRRGAMATESGPLARPFAVGADGEATDVHIRVRSFSGMEDALAIGAGTCARAAGYAERWPLLRCVSASDRVSLIEALDRPDAPPSGGVHGWPRLAIVADDSAGLSARAADARAALARGETPSGPGIFYRDRPLGGELAFVFTGVAPSYAGMGRGLFGAFPEIAGRVASRHPGIDAVARDLYGSGWRASPLANLQATVLVSQAHALLAREIIGVEPAAMLGLSAGETNALFAAGVWRDMSAMFGEMVASRMYDEHLGGRCMAASRFRGLEGPTDWRAIRVIAPLDDVRAALRHTDRAHVAIVIAPDDCVVAGDSGAVGDLAARFGPCADIGHPLVVHCPELAPFAETWRAIHSRETHGAGALRIYSNAGNEAYVPTREAIADRLTRQALEPIVFPRTIERAWNDGVRAFLEVGPRSVLTKAIGAVLRGREHVAIAMDDPARDSVGSVAAAAGALFVHGHLDDPGRVEARLARGRQAAWTAPRIAERTLTLPGRMPPVPAPRIRSSSDREETLTPASARGVPAALGIYAATASAHRGFMERQESLYQDYLRIVSATRPAAPRFTPAPAPGRPSVRLSRPQLETLASGRISSVLGREFARQDQYRRQVRLPQPPLLLVDRVVSIEGEPGTLGRGRIITETDVRSDAWYLDRGRMPPGVFIEAGQADLLLISWQGIDFFNQGERVYRLLGCELNFHGGGLPRAGDTLRFDIRITGHAITGQVRLFFFEYDCWIGERRALSVRNAQAGFFTDAELAASGGVLWDAADDAADSSARVDAAPLPSRHRAFSREQLDRYLAGDAFGCFGAGFERTAAHSSTPRPPAGRMRLIEEIAEFDPRGGPWGRGYLKATARVPRDAWFYDGHFKDDPCMPGTLMADAATQALACFMTACGHTIDRDGWRFEPDPGTKAKFICRGQVVPDAEHLLEYEVFVEEVIAGPEPVVQAALLCRSDGFKVFHCRHFRLRLVPDVVLDARLSAADHSTKQAFATALPHRVGPDGAVRGDFAALLHCAWGKPSAAFGPMYARFDEGSSVPRLPGPPYHFISRIASVDCPSGVPTRDGTVEAVYEVPADAWYFRDNGGCSMPFAVLMEIVLQPCGWLASYMGFALTAGPVVFRNLDGAKGVVHRAVTPGCAPIVTRARLTRHATAGGTTIVFFRIESYIGGELLMELDTSFGFFSREALTRQTGLPADDEDRARIADVGHDAIDPPADVPGRAPLPTGMLRMIDRVTAFDPRGGVEQLGYIRGVQQVAAGAWYFKAHFYTDPVQPGSLGIEALLQLLQCFIRLRGLDAGFDNPRFDAVAPGRPVTWKFRGQVTPEHREVITELAVVAIDVTATEAVVVARGSLWVDGVRIYEVENLAIRVGEDRAQ